MAKPTIADIFNTGFERYVAATGSLPAHYFKAVRDITSCRTQSLGGDRYGCDHCDYEATHYHSCGNRNCPTCQRLVSKRWVKRRLSELLPLNYFHVVFTIPFQLNEFALRNKESFYRLLFASVKQTLLELGANPKWIGGTVGFILVLHSWGQNLSDHPHVHCIVPSGGISPDEKRWMFCKQDSILFPVKVMSALFRGKLMDGFRSGLQSGKIALHGTLKRFEAEGERKKLIDDLYAKDWVVYAKQPFTGPAQVLEYLSDYTHRIGISNSRIISADATTVSFSYKDYADGDRIKKLTVSTQEFIRRFLLHILPPRFVKVRFCGFLANRCRKKMLSLAFRLLNATQPPAPHKQPWYELCLEFFGFDPRICRKCKTGMMIRKEMVLPDFSLSG
jgi:hypothetical protein